jgi:hypothetical protein
MLAMGTAGPAVFTLMRNTVGAIAVACTFTFPTETESGVAWDARASTANAATPTHAASLLIRVDISGNKREKLERPNANDPPPRHR